MISSLGRLAVLVLATAGVGASAQAADVVSPAPDGVRLTLYRADTLPPLARTLNGGRGLALVTETRTVDVPAGAFRLVFQGVADTLVPQSVQLQGLPGPVTESDFDYDLLSPGALVARSIGREVQVVRTDPKTGRVQSQAAVVRSAPDGVALQTAHGVEGLRCSGLPERLVFDRLPQGLAARPTLSVQARVTHGGRYRMSLSYLATGFDWSATYVAALAPDDRSLALSGWLTLQNGAATGFANAPTDLVAGRLARTGDDQPVHPSKRLLEAACWRSEPWWQLMQGVPAVMSSRQRLFKPVAMMEAIAPPAPMAAPPPPPPPPPPPMAKQSDLGDYKLYSLPEPTTVAARQTKQVRFLDKPAVTFERLYVYDAPWPSGKVAEDTRTRITLALKNVPSQGLGEPLPSGRVAVMAFAPSGAPLFAAGDHLDDTPLELPFELSLGLASQVRARAATQAVQAGRLPPVLVEPPARRRARVPHAWDVEVELTNAGAEPALVELRQPDADDIRLSSEDLPHVLDRGFAKWRVPVPPHASARLHYAYAER